VFILFAFIAELGRLFHIRMTVLKEILWRFYWTWYWNILQPNIAYIIIGHFDATSGQQDTVNTCGMAHCFVLLWFYEYIYWGWRQRFTFCHINIL